MDGYKQSFHIVSKEMKQHNDNIYSIGNSITKLKDTVQNLSVSNNTEKMLIFAIDSVRFQSRIVTLELDNIKRIVHSLHNHIYKEYFKFFQTLKDTFRDIITSDKVTNTVTSFIPKTYIELEPYKVYDPDQLAKLHDVIITLIYTVSEYVDDRQSELIKHENNYSEGLNIHNFITVFKHDIQSDKSNVDMFKSYLCTLHITHIDYCSYITSNITRTQKYIDSIVVINS